MTDHRRDRDEDTDSCRCARCRGTFTTPAAFDRHRLRGWCADPAERGLVAVPRLGRSGWGWPQDR